MQLELGSLLYVIFVACFPDMMKVSFIFTYFQYVVEFGGGLR